MKNYELKISKLKSILDNKIFPKNARVIAKIGQTELAIREIYVSILGNLILDLQYFPEDNPKKEY